MNPPAADINHLTLRIESAIKDRMSSETNDLLWVTHYGANDIHPKYLVYWVCVRSDAEKARLQADEALLQELRSLLDTYEYPIEGREEVFIGFESQETVDRESNGNWYHHWK